MVRPPLRARAIGPARNATKAIGPAAATPTATEHDGEQQQQRRCGRDGDAQPGRGVVAELGDPQRPGEPHAWRAAAPAEHGREQPDRRPVGAVDAAGQPAQHQLGVVLVDAGEDVLDDRLQGGGDADADQDEPVARRVAGDQRTTTRDADRAGDRRGRDRHPATQAEVTIANTAAALAPRLTPMMSGLASGLRSVVWKIAPPTPNAAPTSTPSTARGSLLSIRM